MKKKIFNIENIKKMYYLNKISVNNIAKQLNVSPITLTKFFKENNLERNNKSHTPKIIFTDRQIEVLTGCLLGDGHLSKIRSNSYFSYTSNIENHIKFVYNEFNKYMNDIRFINYYDKRTNKTYYRYITNSILNETFTDLRQKWYPNGKKIIPNNIKLTSTVCLFWYIGDGGLIQNYKKKKTSYLKLSTQCFNEDDIDNILIPQLQQFNAYRYNKLIFIPKINVDNFLSFIGDCPIPEYECKWNVFPYKNKNIEQNGVKSHKHLKEIIILKGVKGEIPLNIAKELNIDNNLVKYYLKQAGLFKYNTENHLLKNWILVDPNGIEHRTNNISIFAKEHGLSHKCLRDIAHGRSKFYKKWICKIEN